MSLTQILSQFPEQIDQINRSGIVEWYIVFKTSGSIKAHPNEHQNGHQLSTKRAPGSDQSSVRSWPVQPLSSAAG